ncbi:hypothetical protein FPCIR_9948, partial [Fusarium pseudocircinatum]
MESTKINARRVWSSIVRHAKEHHESVNAAVVAYYPQPSPAYTPGGKSATSSVLSSPRYSPTKTKSSSHEQDSHKMDGLLKMKRQRHAIVPINKPGFVFSFVCLCSDCRKITASMFTTGIVVLDTHLKHIRGEENLKKFSQSDTIERDGSAMTNFFCMTCGSLMYRRSSAYEGVSILRAGTVDDFKLVETVLKPDVEQF